MSKKARAYISLDDNCLCWKIETKTGSNQFAVGLELQTDGSAVLKNFLWEIPMEKAHSLKSFLTAVADAMYIQRQKDQKERPRKYYNNQRMEVERIRIKPDMEERFQSILKQLKPCQN